MMRAFISALWSGLTLAENVALPLEQYTRLSSNEIKVIVSFKLALVGLRGFEDFYPVEISGGMKKRAGLARAMALDPAVLFFDEPSADDEKRFAASGVMPLGTELGLSGAIGLIWKTNGMKGLFGGGSEDSQKLGGFGFACFALLLSVFTGQCIRGFTIFIIGLLSRN